LWTIPPQSELDEKRERRYSLLQHTLESAFCHMFQSLPPDALELYFGRSDDPAGYSSLGLNIIPLPLQSLNLDLLQRRTFKLVLATSIDPEIQSWPDFRKAQYLHQVQMDPKPPIPEFTYDSYVGAVATALNREVSVWQM
jgi:hypothetical protein